ncbi:hypothetical protein O0L34_g12119 [Tuta absoluta]|nr:hypothetical protein O0L34_g12119 [Tuta absoluta]
MADTFFGLDTSLSNLNDDEGGGGPSEDEYDALNDETFGQDSDILDWEVEHEHLAEQLESSRRHPPLPSHRARDDQQANLEASLSQLVLDEPDAVQSRTLGSSVWRHDAPFAPTPVPTLKNVCTVEELERQLRQKQQHQHQQGFQQQNFYQPRYPPVILQRPPGLQAPVPLPFAPQQNVQHNMTQMSQPMNNIMGQNQPMGPNNLMQNQMGQNVNQMGQNMNQMGQNVNQMGQNVNQMGQNVNQMGQNMNQMGQNHVGQNVNQFMQNVNQMNSFQNNQMHQNNMMGIQQNMPMHQMGQNVNQMGQNVNQTGLNFNQMPQNVNQMSQNAMQTGQNFNQLGPNVNQMGPNMNQMGPNINQMPPNANQMGPNVNQMGPNVNQIGPNINQMGPNVNQMMQNGNQFNPGMNFPHMLGQPRLLAPPPGMAGMAGMAMPHPAQNFNQNMGQFNHNFRGPVPPKPEQPLNHQNMMNQPLMPLKQSNQITQKPNLQPPQLQSPQNKTPNKIMSSTPNQKMQKSRVYNNSKNLTSQNLVQMIQNTHPMLQYNNSFHNASHHPMLNNRSFNNSQFVNNNMFNNQRQNGSFTSNMHSMNGDDGSSDEERDEYAGLMTSREKQWLVNIQLLQLSSGTPYIHDFYYTVFLERQANKEKEGIKEAHKANQQNHPFYSNNENSGNREIRSRERHNSLMSASGEEGAPRTYAPAQFENSLGKLQCGSVTAPRKIIDVEVVQEQTSLRTSRAPSRASTTNPAEIPREMRRTKQLLLDIEALYLILLRLEELNDPLAISNALILKEREEKQKQAEALAREAREREGPESEQDECNVFLRNIESVQRRPRPAAQPPDSPKSDSVDKRQVVNLAVSAKPPVKNLLDENKDELIEKIFAGLLHASDRVQQVLTVRKGRLLLSRFVARVAASHSRLRALWARVLRAIPTAARAKGGRDEELAALAPHYRRYIQNTSGWSAILESCSMLSEALDPARTPTALTTALTLSCVCALIEKASTLVNTPEATSNERQWSKFLKTLARALKNTTLTVSRPANPLPEHKLTHHLKQLESRTTIEILQRGRSATEFADVSKTDVMEQLIKHLC